MHGAKPPGSGPPLHLPDSSVVVRHGSSGRATSDCPARPRLAYQVTGCIRALNASLPHKLANVRAAQDAGFDVDLYCVLEECVRSQAWHESSAPVEDAGRAAIVVDSLVAGFRAIAGPCAEVRCAWWAGGAGLFKRPLRHGPNHDGQQQLALKPEYRPAHPEYPYPQHECTPYNGQVFCTVENVLAQAHKLALVGQLRTQTGRSPYAAVWRSRPDFFSKGHDWPRIMALVQFWVAHNESRFQYALPAQDPAHPALHFTDVEAFLSERAAERYEGLWYSIPALYRAGVLLHPEKMLSRHMSGGQALGEGEAPSKVMVRDLKALRSVVVCRMLHQQSGRVEAGWWQPLLNRHGLSNQSWCDGTPMASG